MKPPSGGPITGPISAGTVTHVIALTNALLSIERSSTSRPTGVIIAPPMPCRMRAMTKWVTFCASAQPLEPLKSQPQRPRADLMLYRHQRPPHHRLVHIFHEHGTDDDQPDQPLLVHRNRV